MTRRHSFIAAALLAAAGVAVSVLLIRQHVSAYAGESSACNLGEFVNCDRVATSAYSVFLGLPVAAWGLLGFGLLLILSVVGLGSRRAHEGWPAGLLFAGAAGAAATSVLLAGISEFAIGALCLYCAVAWTISFALLATAWSACRPEGIGAALRADLGLLRARPLRSAGTVVAMLVLVAVAVRAQDRYWEKRPAAPAATAPAPAPAASAGPTVVVEFSDYECPFCAKAHDELRALLGTRPDVTLVKRHFPLDSSCNPIMKRPMHPNACALARAAICAEREGRLTEMDDALFHNQKLRRPVEELAAGIGLDVAEFRACLIDPETTRRLSSDIATGLQIGLKATPTYVVNGVQYTGSLPAVVLPPPSR